MQFMHKDMGNQVSELYFPVATNVNLLAELEEGLVYEKRYLICSFQYWPWFAFKDNSL